MLLSTLLSPYLLAVCVLRHTAQTRFHTYTKQKGKFYEQNQVTYEENYRKVS